MSLLLWMAALVSTSAYAAPKESNPGLDTVCTSVQEEPTAAETLAAAFSIARYAPTCDLAVSEGLCLNGGAKVVLSSNGAASIVPIVPLESDAEELPLFVFTAFDTYTGTDPRVATVYVNGEVVGEDLPADQPIEVFARFRRSRNTTHLLFKDREGEGYISLREIPVAPVYGRGDTIEAGLGLVGSWNFDDGHGIDTSLTTPSGVAGETLTIALTFEVVYSSAL